jgi:[acyl-carrier-protein] S-malonyltransferase
MGKELYNVVLPLRSTFDQAEKLLQPLGLKVAKACWMGPEEELEKSSYGGPALLAITHGLVEFFKQKHTRPQMLAGQGWGEILALVAANVLTYEQGLLYLRKRGQILEEALAASPYYVATVTGMPVEELEAKFQPLARRPLLVGHLAPDVAAYAGEEDLLKRTLPLLAGRTVKVSPVKPGYGWPHPSLEAAGKKVAAEFLKLKPQLTSGMEIYSCTRGDFVPNLQDLPEIQGELCFKPILWTQTMKNLFQRGANTVIEMGSGQALGAAARKVNAGARILASEDAKTLSTAIKLAN